jgi:small-conductance mechanosensitive channel/CRP-like cAMP-binding protein
MDGPAWIAEAKEGGTLLVVAGLPLTLLLLRVIRSSEPTRVRGLVSFSLLHFLFAAFAALLRPGGSFIYRDVRIASMAFAAVACVSMAGALLFAVLLPRIRVHVPRILQDVLVASVAIAAVFIVASRNGFNLSSLIATSAVITAVIGFSLQDTLGNVAGGLALQVDSSIDLGDWVKFGDVSGQVKEIRWRYTAVETRNWETVIIPNSALMKGPVTVLGRRAGKPVQVRRWVWFNVDFRHSPTEVIRIATTALSQAELPNVALEPPPNCVLMDFSESYGRYAVRYWLTNLAVDDPTDSSVRAWIFFALKRAGIPMSIPARAVFVTEESDERKAHKEQLDQAARVQAIGCVELFAHVSDTEREALARRLHPAPFAAGEVMTHEGAAAHWLYILRDGEASVRVSAEGGMVREVARLHGSDFFGEISLMTGAPRSATVVALTDVDCYRLDKTAFQDILHARPELAEQIASLLAHRSVELSAVRENLDHEAKARRLAAEKIDLLTKIRGFFGLADERAAG